MPGTRPGLLLLPLQPQRERLASQLEFLDMGSFERFTFRQRDAEGLGGDIIGVGQRRQSALADMFYGGNPSPRTTRKNGSAFVILTPWYSPSNTSKCVS